MAMTMPISEFEAYYPEVISDLGQTFAAHEFVLALARRYEQAYARALAAYVDYERPFQELNAILSAHLADFPGLVVETGERTITDLFGNLQRVSVWRKVE
ncbi:MAG: hypothetical protein AB4911_16220 [Oscillochloridaceae bacterium umkhey_bin13]